MNHKGTVVLETKRLILRPFVESDATVMFTNWAGNDNVTRYLTWPTHQCADVTKEVIAYWMAQYSNPQCYEWCIEYKNNHQAIGGISIVALDQAVDAADVGYCISEDYWYKGMTAEAFRAVIKFLFKEVGVNRISARYDTRNVNSGKVMAKCGLQYEGTQRQAGKNNTGVCDVATYAILKAEYTTL